MKQHKLSGTEEYSVMGDAQAITSSFPDVAAARIYIHVAMKNRLLLRPAGDGCSRTGQTALQSPPGPGMTFGPPQHQSQQQTTRLPCATHKTGSPTFNPRCMCSKGPTQTTV